MSVAWVFNLDAEDELARGGPHTPTHQMRARVECLLPELHSLMQPDDEVLWPSSQAPRRAREGRAWCPTNWARSQLERAGLAVPAAPSPEVLRRVNHRRFAHALGQALPGARFVETQSQLLETLADAALLNQVSRERNWLMKRPLGYAGRGRRKIAPGGAMSPADVTWVGAALRSGDGLQIEPLVERELDCALHGLLEADGRLVLGEPTCSVIDASGTWRSSALAGPELSGDERASLVREATATASALHDAGYFGPFGIDAFRWRASDDTVHFQPRCELNARYSMGWAIGMRGVKL